MNQKAMNNRGAKSLLAAPLALALVLALGGCGLMAPRGNDGFARFGSLGLWDVDRKINLSIGPTILRIARRLTEEGDEETGAFCATSMAFASKSIESMAMRTRLRAAWNASVIACRRIPGSRSRSCRTDRSGCISL
jgi:hypothetical protein